MIYFRIAKEFTGLRCRKALTHSKPNMKKGLPLDKAQAKLKEIESAMFNISV